MLNELTEQALLGMSWHGAVMAGLLIFLALVILLCLGVAACETIAAPGTDVRVPANKGPKGM